MKIEVLDAIMGSGKTTGIIKWMQDNPNNKYLYVSPMLTEVEERIPTQCTSIGFVSPSTEDYDTKSEHLLKLLKAGKNVSFTHSLFQDLSREHLYWIRVQEYVLVIDEEINFIEPYTGIYSKFDITSLEKKGHVEVDEENLGRVIWKWEELEEQTAYSKMRKLCDLGMLFCTKRTRDMMVLHLPIELITSASRVIVLTYLFEGSVMEAFMKLKNIEISTFTEVPLLKSSSQVKLEASDLITIANTRATRALKRTKGMTLSSTWYKENADRKDLEQIKNCIRYLYRKAGKDKFLFTCPKQSASKIRAGTKASVNTRSVSHKEVNVDETFLYCAAKATNDYAHKNVLVHAYNRFCNVSVKSYLSDYGSPISDDNFALSELIQWVWRSAIRNDEPVSIYFLNNRMESLFERWLSV